LKKILVIGSSNVDLVVDVPHTPKTGETILAKNMLKLPGGKGANQAFACGKLGGNVSFLSAIGDDSAGELLTHSLKSANVNQDCVSKIKDADTGIALIYIDAEGDNCIVVITGANDSCDVDYVTSHDDMLKDCDIMMIQAEVPIDAVLHSIRVAGKYGKTVIFNPAPAPKGLPDDIWKDIDFLTPNESELEILAGVSTDSEENMRVACGKLLEKGVKNVIITLGARGALLCNSDTFVIYPAYKVKAVDTTAAGDTFNGALAVALAKGWNLADSIDFANRAAAVSVSRKGAQASIPSQGDIVAYFEQ